MLQMGFQQHCDYLHHHNHHHHLLAITTTMLLAVHYLLQMESQTLNNQMLYLDFQKQP
jgi:hypothetical protein